MKKSINRKYKIENLIKNNPIKMEIKDIPQIKEIYKSFWGTIDLFKNSEFKQVIKQNLSYEYKIDNEIIAFCLIEYPTNDNLAEIELLCVKKEYQGYHLGKSLLSFCINNCCNLNIKNFCLHVSSNNIPAINLYKNQGFTTKNFIKDYYHDKDPNDNDAYFMILDMT